MARQGNQPRVRIGFRAHFYDSRWKNRRLSRALRYGRSRRGLQESDERIETVIDAQSLTSAGPLAHGPVSLDDRKKTDRFDPLCKRARREFDQRTDRHRLVGCGWLFVNQCVRALLELAGTNDRPRQIAL